MAFYFAGGVAFARSNSTPDHLLEHIPHITDDWRTTRIAKSLAVNAVSDHRLIVPNKCEDRGEMELRILASASTLEEAYVFLPSLCVWIEVGTEESRTSVTIDKDLIDRLLPDFPNLIIYHIHIGAPRRVEGYFPAYSDLLGLILLNAEHIQAPRGPARHRAVTTLGTIEYALVSDPHIKRLTDKLRRTGLSDYVAQNLAYELGRRHHQENYYSAVKHCRGVIGGQLRQIATCFPLTSGAFQLTFRGFDDMLIPIASE